MTGKMMEQQLQELTPDTLQQAAIDAACDMENRVVAVSGPAGSGKTTVLKKIYDALIEHGYRVALCSPTGKAAKRIHEATGIEALTIHRLLEFTHPGDPDPKTGKPMGVSVPRRTRQNPLEFDVILADEYAMVNDEVHRSLFDALPQGGVVRVFGDDNQLAPIEEEERLKQEPSPFVKLLRNPKFKVIILKTVFRQGADSGILLNATNILKSKMPTKNDQWHMTITDQPVKVLRDYVQEQHQQGIDWSQTENQIIVPQNKGWVGGIALNTMLQGLFFNEMDPCMMVPRKPVYSATGKSEAPDIRMFVGDKVVYVSNNYDLGVFNGETGKIIELDAESGEIIIDFGDREQSIPPLQMVMNRHGNVTQIDPRRDIELAYALTTHKCQGSEFKRVIYIMNKSNSWMLSRRNFYTAITRAREFVHVIADQKGLSTGVFKRD
jgi:exodeoxyribonuclease V alpha subunit